MIPVVYEFFICSSSDLELVRRALIVRDACAAGGVLPRLCVGRACPGLAPIFYRCLLYWNTHPYVVWVSARCIRNWRCDAWRVVC